MRQMRNPDCLWRLRMLRQQCGNCPGHCHCDHSSPLQGVRTVIYAFCYGMLAMLLILVLISAYEGS
ncbi:protein of unknown function [Streptantibioticus cattleyicolor NRRL 8057 = DSM 46488]|nr:protein of unknown function [Streptantibioticus cattleyicolor NRRL 8057 = DSM 46488]